MNIEDLPSEVLSQVTQEAIKRGLMPPPDGYDDDGQPLWSLEAVAAFYGHTPDEGKALLDKFNLDHPEQSGYIDPCKVNRIN